MQLCQVYIDNVDPIIRILHRPSLSMWMMHGERYPDYPEGHSTPEVLGAAVCYSASASMTDESCQAILKVDKSRLVKACRTDCETAISKSALLTSRDITVLQAFVLYLVGCSAFRSLHQSSSIFTQEVKTLEQMTEPDRLPREQRITRPPYGPSSLSLYGSQCLSDSIKTLTKATPSSTNRCGSAYG